MCDDELCRKKVLSHIWRTRTLNFHHIFHCVWSFCDCWDLWTIQCSFTEQSCRSAMVSHGFYLPSIVLTKLNGYRRSAERLRHLGIDRHSTNTVNESHLAPRRKPSAVCWKPSADQVKLSRKYGQYDFAFKMPKNVEIACRNRENDRFWWMIELLTKIGNFAENSKSSNFCVSYISSLLFDLERFFRLVFGKVTLGCLFVQKWPENCRLRSCRSWVPSRKQVLTFVC